jgi:hypothetical protein
MPSLRRTDPKEIIAEVQELSGDVERNLARIFELSDTLYASVRHGYFRQERERLETDLRLLEVRLDQATYRGEAPDTLRSLQSAVDGINHQLETHKEIVPVYTMFANAWKRFAGSMHNGLRRASSVNRLVIQVHNKHGLAQHTAPVTPTPQPPQTNGASVDDLVELYGEETLNG